MILTMKKDYTSEKYQLDNTTVFTDVHIISLLRRSMKTRVRFVAN